MRLRFTKMQGAGNDFIVIDGVRQRVVLAPAQWRALADRHFGVGADQLLLVEEATQPGIDFRYRIFNSDGGEVEQCGNGARCFARFVFDQGLTTKRSIRVETLAGVIEPQLEDDGRVTVDMGAPVFEPRLIPFRVHTMRSSRVGGETLWPLQVRDHVCWVAALSMGNPHAVQLVEDVDTAPVLDEGPAIEHHSAFPNRVNAGFMQLLAADRIRLRVWERGAGETLACGTGACAAAVSGIRRGLLRSPVDVEMRGGTVTIAWEEGGTVRMTGPAARVFEGEVDLADLQ